MSAEPGQTAPPAPGQPTPATGPQLQPGGLSRPLSTKDKLQLNRRAKKHGLPALWPEAEEEAKKENARKIRAALAETVLRREEHRNRLCLEQQMAFSGVGPAAGGAWPGGMAGYLHGLQGDPAFAMRRDHPEDYLAEAALGGMQDLGGALRSFFSCFRGPIPW